MARRGAGPAPFLIKTHQMVEAPATDDVISWGENGKSFIVRKPVEFARDLLPVHFKHDNFSSFVRQLNTYGFRKVVPNKWEFANEHFRKGEPNLLCNIRRRKLASPANAKSNSHHLPPPLPPPSTTTTSSTTSSPLSSPCHDLVALTNENEQLKKANETLSSELAIAKKRCNELLGFLSKFVDVKELDFRISMEGDEREVKEEVKEEECREFKLFGVRLKGTCGRKRGLSEDCDTCGVAERPMKIGFGSQWIGSVPVVPMQQSSGKVK